MENPETSILQKQFYEWIRMEIDEMPKRDYNSFNDMKSSPLNKRGDIIYLYLGNSEKIWMFVKSGDKKSPERDKRMLDYSNAIRNRLSDQQPFRDKKSENKGMSIGIQKDWTLSDPDKWPQIVYWVKIQFKRLKEIIVEFE